MTRLRLDQQPLHQGPGYGVAGPKRILFTDYYAFVGGGQQNLLNVFAALDRKRWQPILAVNGEGAFAEAARKLKVPVHVVTMKKARWRLAWQAFPAMRRLRALMERERVDLVHANDFPSLKLAVVAAKGLGIPTLYHHQIAVTQRPGSTTGWLLKHYAVRADRVIAVSQNGLDALAALGVPRAKLRLLYNNADTAGLAKAKALPSAALKKAGIPARPLIVAAGMRRPHKGFDVLLEGLTEFYGVPGRDGSVGRPYTTLLGDVANAEEGHEALLKRLEGNIALVGNFKALPAQRPLAPWLKKAALFVSSSRWEGSPLVVLEAMAAGCAVLATRQASGEVVAHGKTGWLVESEDPSALADGLKRLMADKALRQRLGKAAQASVRGRFSLKAYMGDLAQHYRELTGAR
jgi:glycosyltransferase involved in cell wall biosynthesis